MDFVPEWAPNVHPMFVHFPIGLLVTAVVLDFLSLLPRTDTLRRAVPVLYVAGAIAAIVTYFTGRSAADGLTISADAEPLLTEHADLALWTVLFFVLFAAIRAGLAWWKRESSLAIRVPLAVAGIIGLFLIWETAEHGSEMVYRHAVAVNLPAQTPDALQPPSDHLAHLVHAEHLLNVDESGWTLEAIAPGALQHARIDWLLGDPEQSARPDSGGSYTLEASGEPVMFVVDETLGDVQLTVELDRSDFKGAVALIHHLQDAETYDYLTLTDDGAALGRVGAGSGQTFDKKGANYSGWMSVRVTGDGTHFRGYVNDQMIVHGHADPLPPGRVGLRVEGEGILKIRRLQARAL